MRQQPVNRYKFRCVHLFYKCFLFTCRKCLIPLYYVCRNHPFLDGNKRTALGASIVFLRLNGIKPKADGPEWEELTLAVAASRIDRDETTARVRRLMPGHK